MKWVVERYRSLNGRCGAEYGIHVSFLTGECSLHQDSDFRSNPLTELFRLLAMTFGRPTMLSSSWDVPVPALIDDEYLNNGTEGHQPEGKPSVMGLFVSSCDLFQLLEEILNSFYSGEPFPDLSKQEKASDMAKAFIAPVLQYNRRLDEFIDSVPSYLKLGQYGEGAKFNSNSVALQQQVLYSRYACTR
jgi:hypothetical protein